MKLYSLLNNIILEAANRQEVETAIENHQTARIYYENDEGDEGDGTLVTGWRWVEPYVLGLSKAGNLILRAYQIQGVTDTEQPGWKTFRIDKITSWNKTPKTFYSPISDRDTRAPKYNDKGDRSMITIYKQAKF